MAAYPTCPAESVLVAVTKSVYSLRCQAQHEVAGEHKYPSSVTCVSINTDAEGQHYCSFHLGFLLCISRCASIVT